MRCFIGKSIQDNEYFRCTSLSQLNDYKWSTFSPSSLLKNAKRGPVDQILYCKKDPFKQYINNLNSICSKSLITVLSMITVNYFVSLYYGR